MFATRQPGVWADYLLVRRQHELEVCRWQAGDHQGFPIDCSTPTPALPPRGGREIRSGAVAVLEALAAAAGADVVAAHAREVEGLRPAEGRAGRRACLARGTCRDHRA